MFDHSRACCVWFAGLHGGGMGHCNVRRDCSEDEAG